MNENILTKSILGDVLEIDFSIKIFGKEIFRFHYPPQKD